MKKSAIALAVAGAMSLSATAVAETTFYGSVRTTINYTDGAFGARSKWDVGDGGTRWGVKGSEDLGNGLSAIYHIETELDADTYNGRPGNSDSGAFRRDGLQVGRLAWVGLKGGFGAVKVGSQWSPYYNVGGRADIFNDAKWYAYYQGPFRINNTVLYETPDSITSVKAEASVSMDGDSVSSKDIDDWQLGANVSFGPFGGGVAYRDFEAANELSQWIVAASVDFAGASIAAMYEQSDFDNNSILGEVFDDVDTFYLTAQYTIGNNILKAGYGKINPSGNSNVSNGDQWALGVQHNLSKRTRLWLEYAATDQFRAIRDADGFLTRVDDDDEQFWSLGLRHDF